MSARQWEFRTMLGDTVAEFTGSIADAVEAIDETSRVLGVALALYSVATGQVIDHVSPASAGSTERKA